MNPNKQAAIEQAEKLRAELDKLQAIINQPDEPEVPTYEQVVRKVKPAHWFFVSLLYGLSVAQW
ncbi:MAG: hypothetical protein WC341_17735 [Bacteroidales bacterium]